MKRSVMALRHSLTGRAFVAVGALVATAAFTTPAIANSASASDNFRISPEELEKNETALGVSDPEFRALHGDWGKAIGQSTRVEISVPSINPVEAMKLSSGFGRRRAPKRGASRNHKGIDIPGPIGTPIYATADGIVGRAKWVRGYGKFIELEHGNEIQTRYGHMSALNVRFGQRVEKGDTIGYMGSTGNSTGSHLHYEVRIGGLAVNPMSFIGSDRNGRKKSKQLLVSKEVDTKAIGGPEE